MDGTILFSGSANFGKYESMTFIAAASGPWPLSPITPSSVSQANTPVIIVITITLNFDAFTPFIGYELSDTAQNVVATAHVGTFSSTSGSVVQQVELDYGKEYIFTIFSSSQHGQLAEGSYSLTSDGITLVSGGANFGRQESTSFTAWVPAVESRTVLADSATFNPRVAGNSKQEHCSIEVCP
jgi:hypothetical protein